MATPISRVDVSTTYVAVLDQLMAGELSRSRVWLGGDVDVASLVKPSAASLTSQYREMRDYVQDSVVKIVSADGGGVGTVGDFTSVCLQGNTVDLLRRARRTRGGTTVSRLVHAAARREYRADKNGGVYAKRFKQAAIDHIASGASQDDVVSGVA
jgi:DNA-directed RNA polymerase specialized sigma24 family protein